MPESGLHVGQIVSAHGRHHLVRLDGSDQIVHCHIRGKRAGMAVGDKVQIELQGASEGVISDILPRRNKLARADANRSKLFAANIDQVLLLIAAEPEFSHDLLGRALVASNSAGIPAIVVLNKSDLPGTEQALESLAHLVRLDIPVIAVSSLDSAQIHERLEPLLRKRTSLLLGQSAMGKSTLLNVLVPDARAATQAHSVALGAGRHTTTATRMYDLPGGGKLIDSPGLQSFGLTHLSTHEIQQGFPEFATEEESCRFHNCSHRHEPGCLILHRLEQGIISPERHALYQRILAENERARPY